MANFLFKRKSLASLSNETVEGGENSLKRQLGAWNLTSLGIGAIIGAGLFSITGFAAGDHAGPAVTISFVIAAVGCAFAGLCYAEFSSMIPVAGSAYTYSYATMGQMMAWIIGWDLVLEYAVGAATVAISWSRYLGKFLENLGLGISPQFFMSPFEHVTTPEGVVINGIINIPAVIIVVLISLLLIKGTKESATVNNIIVAIKVTVVFVFIALGFAYINPANYTPYIPENTGEFGYYGWSGIVRAAGIIFFAYIGFDAVSTAAQEAKNPQRDMPIGILLSLAICTVLYILFAHVMTGLANYTEFKGFDGIAPVAVAISHTPYVWLKQGIIFAILAGYSSVIMVMLMGQSRVFFSMSRDKLLPAIFSDVHPVYKTPWKSNALFCLFVSLFAAFVPAKVVGEMTSIGTLLAFVLVCIGIIVLRKTDPDAPRPFKTPLVPLVPILGVLVCFGMMAGLPWDTWLRLIIWLALGMAIYFGYSYKKANQVEA
ncbi:MAG: amino acid permease [Chloroherpetonaceae bacterium]|nr:amino acid permease [Chloroherpetonaceae bacterium]